MAFAFSGVRGVCPVSAARGESQLKIGRWICDVVGHQATTVQSKWIANSVGGEHWAWPGVISFCPRCGMVYRPMGPEPAPPNFYPPLPEKTSHD